MHCSSGKPSTASRSTTSWVASRRARRRTGRRRPPSRAAAALPSAPTARRRRRPELLPLAHDKRGFGPRLFCYRWRLMIWQTARFAIDLTRARVMGIVNVTPDSFFDGGRHSSVDAARAHCERLVDEGADILDIGGESTRPGARPPGVQEEVDR